jgi:4-alpha-glucanotransferase
MGTPFAFNPAMIDPLRFSELNLSTCTDRNDHSIREFVALCNARGREIREEHVWWERGEFRHTSLRAFKLKTLEINERALRERGKERECGFTWHLENCLRDGASDSESRKLDYAVFETLRERHNGRPWQDWDDRTEKTPTAFSIYESAPNDIRERARFHLYAQWETMRQVEWYANAVRQAGGFVIGDKSFGVDPNNAEVLRSWRNWYRRSRPGPFLLDSYGWPPFVTGLEGNLGRQVWGHAVQVWDDRNFEASWEFLRDSLGPIAQICCGTRIDCTLALSNGHSCFNPVNHEERYFVYGPKTEVFRRMVDTYQRLAFYAEAAGFVPQAAHDAYNYFGLRTVENTQWGFSPHEGNPATIFQVDNVDTAFASAIVNAGYCWREKAPHINGILDASRGRKWDTGGNVDQGVRNFIGWHMNSVRQFVATTLASLAGEVRSFNVVGAQDPSFWQLVCWRPRHELMEVFDRFRAVIDGTQRGWW